MEQNIEQNDLSHRILINVFHKIIITFTSNEIIFLDEETGNIRNRLEQKLNLKFNPIQRDNGFVVMTRDKKLMYFDYELRELWTVSLNQYDLSIHYLERSRILSLRDYIVIVTNQDILFFDEMGQLAANYKPSNPPYNIFVLNEDQIGLIINKEFFIFDVNESTKMFKDIQFIQFQPISLNGENFVAKLSPKHLKYGIYEYSFGIFDLKGNVKIIKEERQIQFMTVDRNGNIVVLVGVTGEVYGRLGHLIDQLNSFIKIYDLNGNELVKIDLNTHLFSPLTISEKGELVYYLNHHLVFLTP